MKVLPSKPTSRESRIRQRKRWSVLLSFLTIVLIAISCVTVNRTVMAPPHIPGATFVGSAECATCHEDKTKDFKTATHGRLMAKGENAANAGCESCHGPGSLHVEAGGGKGKIVNPGKSPEACFQCHLDKQAEFHLPHTHPVLEGKMSCTDCHNPHEGDAVKGGGTSMTSSEETCFQCHTMQKGPFIFPHEAIREGCISCHAPHGSVNQKMLIERNSNLCLKCHFQQQTGFGQILIGGSNHSGRLNAGSCWKAGCHEAVHGSQVNTSLRF